MNILAEQRKRFVAAPRLMASLASLGGIGTHWHTGHVAARQALIPDQSRLVSGGLSPNHLTISALQRRLNISEDLDFSENNSGIIDQSPSSSAPPALPGSSS
jgi:hypothetical protein